MRTIETTAIVSADRTLTVDVPSDIPPGEHRVVLVIDEEPIDHISRPPWHSPSTTLARGLRSSLCGGRTCMANSDGSAIFIDTNVLVYAAIAAAPLHQVALDTIEHLYNAGADLWISRQVLREYLATLSRPQSFSRPLPWETLAHDIRHFESRFRVAEDGPAVTDRLLALWRGFLSEEVRCTMRTSSRRWMSTAFAAC